MEEEFDEEADEIEIPRGLADGTGSRHPLPSTSDLRAGKTPSRSCSMERRLERVREEKQKAKKKSGDFTSGDEDD